MDIFALDPVAQRERDAKLQRQAAEPYAPPEPTTWQGSAPALGLGVARGLVRLGQASEFALGYGPAVLADKLYGTGTENEDAFFRFHDETIGKALDFYRPNARTTGIGAHYLGGFAELVPSLALGPAAPEAVAATVTLGTGTDLVNEGVDGVEAGRVAALAGTAAVAGFKIAPSLGRTAVERIGGTAVANVALNASTTAAQSEVLERGGYTDLAARYNFADPGARLADLAAGFGFGSLEQLAVARARATVATANNWNTDSAPGGVPATAADQAAHDANMSTATEQVRRGEPVSLPDRPMPRTTRNLDEIPLETRRTLRYDHSALDDYVRAEAARQDFTPEEAELAIAIKNAGEKSNSREFSTFVNKKTGEVGHARGVMQVTDKNGKRLGQGDPTDPKESIRIGLKYLKETLKFYHGNFDAVIADYNGGPRQARYVLKGKPPTARQTADYFTRVKRYMAEHARSSAPRSPVAPSPTEAAPGAVAPGLDPSIPATASGEPPAALVGPAPALGLPVPTRATTDAGTAVPVRYEVRELDTVRTSHGDDMAENPDYPAELQPRDRDRAGYLAQVTRIENELRPDEVAESPRASDGAPILDENGAVLSGNGRSIAIRRAYAAGKDTATGYREYLAANAERYGLSRDQVEGMRAPVLVRVADTTGVDLGRFTREANDSGVAEMSPTERARSDARGLGDLSGLVLNADDTINWRGSKALVAGMVANAGKGAANALMTGDGSLSQAGQARFRNALFAKAYDSPELAGLLMESTDSNIKNVLAGLTRSAPAVARLRDLIAAGARFPKDFSTDLAAAVRQFAQLRAEGRTVDDFFAQADAFDDMPPQVRAMLEALGQRSRAPARLAEYVAGLVDDVERLGDPRQADMFGGLPNMEAIADAAGGPVPTRPTGGAGARPGEPVPAPESGDLTAARAALVEAPDMLLALGADDDAPKVPAATLLEVADARIAQAEKDAQAFETAVLCGLTEGLGL